MIHIEEEAPRCLLCENATCGAKVARAIRAIRFDNAADAWHWWSDCTDVESAVAEAACIHYDKPIQISELRTANCEWRMAQDAGCDRRGAMRWISSSWVAVTCRSARRCCIACMDGGHQAIEFGEDRKPRVVGSRCVGCHLCRLVCPTNAIGQAKRIQKR